ncbi:serine/threonine protein kinase [Leptolyngbya sp. NIES-2104]|uniref:serine/threonine protein kinase n=1 Tax=Leptolyngbya sp. NIES-2104 TaxID=1552121 RepID=UPI0006EC5C46|nr:serine/threonine-protein kinase [Leptolyngbya sp. NIES-2104]GAP97899.1 serine/threonine kinase [Leptolyngbya sp. NIES-2104]
MDQLIGKVLRDRYQIQSLLGRQTGRRTFLAKDLQSDAIVVVKLLLFAPEFTWEDLKLFEREAAVLRSLNHRAIPQYLDDFEVETDLGKGFALVQTHIEARSLQDWIQSGRTFSEEELRAIAKDLLSILDYLHSRQPPVVHRDLKPSNILLGNRTGNHPGRIYLIDFGSVQTALHHGTRTIVGTYGYMPPEQFGGQTVPASDLYALGATLICIATGQNPDQLPQREMRILFDKHVNLSPDLIDWLKWLTEPSLDLRLQSAKQALEALDAPRTLAKGQPVGSKVQFARSRQTLEIVIPSRGFHLGLIPLLGFALFWNSFLIMWYGMALISWSSGGWFMALFAIGHLAAGLWMTWGILFDLFGQVRLEITESKIFRANELFGIGIFPLTADRRSICRIDRTQDTYKHDSEGGHVRIPAHLNIWAGTRKFTLGGGTNNYESLTPPEIDWLAEQLSQWLGLPVDRN